MGFETNREPVLIVADDASADYSPRQKRKYKRRKSLKALGGACVETVALGGLATAAFVVGGLAFGVGSALKGTRKRIGKPMRGKETLFYEAMIMGGFILALAPTAMAGERFTDARFITHRLLGLTPPRPKPKKRKAEKDLSR